MIYVNKFQVDRLLSINIDFIQIMEMTSRQNLNKSEAGIYFLTDKHEKFWWFKSKEDRNQVFQEIVEFSNHSLLT